MDNGITALIVVHNGRGALSKYLLSNNINYTVLETSRLAGSSPGIISIMAGIVFNFIRFSRFIKNNNIDIVHGNDLKINLSWSLPARVFSSGFIWHQRTIMSSSKLWLFVDYLCDIFVAISKVVLDKAPKNMASDKLSVIYNPFHSDSLVNKMAARDYVLEKYKIPKRCFLLGYVGRVVRYKNIDFIIKNMRSINSLCEKDIHLLIAGAGEKKYINELNEYACRLGVQDRVHFTGFVNDSNEIIASLDLLIASSCIDAFGRTLVEAMLQKTPLLAAMSGGHVEIVEHNINGLFYEPYSNGDFTDKVSTVMANENIDKITSNAFQYAVDRFSSEKHLDSMLHIYRKLLTK